MSQGYNRVFQSVTEDLVVEDIRYSVPRGVKTIIPGNKACDSRDLGRLMSEGRIIELGANPRLANALSTQSKVVQPDLEPPVPVLEVQDTILELITKLHKSEADLNQSNVENQRLSSALEESRVECGKLLAEGSRLRAELAKVQSEESKLSTILGKLDNLPAQVVVQSGVLRGEARSSSALDESDVPDFIPSFPTPVSSNMGKPKPTIVEIKGETPGEALRKFRKGKSS